MPDRRQFITGIASLSAVGIAGCLGLTEQPAPAEGTNAAEGTDAAEGTETAEETDAAEEKVSVVLPPNSSYLFNGGELSEHNFAESSLTEDQVERPVSEFDLQNADTSSVENMRGMFQGATSFNQDIGGWDTSNVENMRRMFRQANSFNQDISGWDTSNVENMLMMFFSAESFNQDISGWDTSNVADMRRMFERAVSFNQDISGWCVEQISSPQPYANRFDEGAGFEGDDAKQPNWGEPC